MISASKVLATVDSEGTPNVVPKGTLSAVDEETITFADIFGDKTNKNLEATKRAAASAFKMSRRISDKGTFQGFQNQVALR
jgi:hypothetical protein